LVLNPEDRRQDGLLPEYLDDFVRVIEAFVEELNAAISPAIAATMIGSFLPVLLDFADCGLAARQCSPLVAIKPQQLLRQSVHVHIRPEF
jgi:hypothetical protein